MAEVSKKKYKVKVDVYVPHEENGENIEGGKWVPAIIERRNDDGSYDVIISDTNDLIKQVDATRLRRNPKGLTDSQLERESLQAEKRNLLYQIGAINHRWNESTPSGLANIENYDLMLERLKEINVLLPKIEGGKKRKSLRKKSKRLKSQEENINQRRIE